MRGRAKGDLKTGPVRETREKFPGKNADAGAKGKTRLYRERAIAQHKTGERQGRQPGSGSLLKTGYYDL